MPCPRIIFLLVTCILLAGGRAFGTGGGAHIIHVNASAGGGNTGLDWANAYTSLSEAVTQVLPGTNEIWVVGGGYSNATVIINNDCQIHGGFDGTETNRSQRDLAANETKIDGANSNRCMQIVGATVLLDGITITNGNSLVGTGTKVGSGIHATGGTALTLYNCRVTENSIGTVVAGSGMGIYASGGSVTLSNTVFDSNRLLSHDNQGAGLYANGSIISIIDCAFLRQRPVDGGNGRASRGGAIYMSGGQLSVTNTTFIANDIGGEGATAANSGGGAVWMGSGAQCSFMNCVFLSNTVYHGTQISHGGALSVQGSTTTMTVENCTFAYNTADTFGGAVWVNDGVVDIKNSIFWTNTTRDLAYDIGNAAGEVDISYCDFSDDPDANKTILDSSGIGLSQGSGNFTADPLFAGGGDVHLKSKHGRYDPGIQDFTTDAVHSPCIDAGDPTSPFGNELFPHGSRANIGTYANTDQASKNQINAPTVENRVATVTNNQATLRGELVTVDTTADITIFYGLTDGGEDTGGWQASVPIAPPQQIGTVFETTIGGLLFETNYAFRCFATNSAGFDWAAVSNFSTDSEPPGGSDTVIHVRAGAPGSQNGQTWFDAAPTLAAGVALIEGPTNEIWVANRSEDMNATVTIVTNASIYGGFLGHETNRAERVLTNVTLLHGLGARRALDITAGTVLMDGLTITNCLEGSGNSGHGMRANGSFELTLNNCLFTRNGRHDNCDGAGAYFSGGTVTVSNSIFRENGFGHSLEGGGVHAAGTDLTAVDCIFTNNGAPGYAGRGSNGGGIYQSGGSLVVLRSEFIGNHVGTDGGALGGGIEVRNSASAWIENTVFRHNTGTFQLGRGDGGNGAGLAVNVNAGYTVDVVNCSFAYNTGANRGGAIHLQAGVLNINNAILWSNEVSEVAGADATGSEIFARDGTTLTISYIDITGTTSNEIVVAGTNGTFSIGSGILTTDPLFVSATDLHLQSRNGHYTPLGYVADSATSPCIDAGDPLSPQSHEPDPRGRRINLGAYGNTDQASRTAVTGSVLLFR